MSSVIARLLKARRLDLAQKPKRVSPPTPQLAEPEMWEPVLVGFDLAKGLSQTNLTVLLKDLSGRITPVMMLPPEMLVPLPNQPWSKLIKLALISQRRLGSPQSVVALPATDVDWL